MPSVTARPLAEMNAREGKRMNDRPTDRTKKLMDFTLLVARARAEEEEAETEEGTRMRL